MERVDARNSGAPEEHSPATRRTDTGERSDVKRNRDSSSVPSAIDNPSGKSTVYPYFPELTRAAWDTAGKRKSSAQTAAVIFFMKNLRCMTKASGQ